MSVTPGGDSVPGPHSISRGDWRRSGQVSTGTGLACPQRPTLGTVVCRTMLVLQKTYSGFHGASRPLERVSNQRNGLRMDGTKERGIQAIEEHIDQCADIRVSQGGGAVVPRHRRERCRDGSGAVLDSGQGGTCHCLRQQVAGGEGAEVLHGPQGAVGSGLGIETLQMLSLWAEDQGQDGQQRR